jgi:hypothetical protein
LCQQTHPDNIQHFCQNNGIIKNRCFGGWYQHTQTKYKQPCGGFEITNFEAAGAQGSLFRAETGNCFLQMRKLP